MKRIRFRKFITYVVCTLGAVALLPQRSEGAVVNASYDGEWFIKILDPENIFVGGLIELNDLNKRVPRMVPNPRPPMVTIGGPIFGDIVEKNLLANKEDMQSYQKYVGEKYGSQSKHTTMRFIAGGNKEDSFNFIHYKYGQIVDLKRFFAINQLFPVHKTVYYYEIRRWFYDFAGLFFVYENSETDPVEWNDQLGVVERVIYGRDVIFLVFSNQEELDVKLALEGAIKHGFNKLDNKSKALLYTSEIRVNNNGKAKVLDHSPLINPIDIIMKYCHTPITKEDYGVPVYMTLSRFDGHRTAFWNYFSEDLPKL